MSYSHTRQNLFNKKILYIENSYDQAKFIKILCSNAHMHCDVAQDSSTGIEKCKTSHYDIIFIHIGMPMMDGYNIAKEIKTQKITTPILFTSGHTLSYLNKDIVNEFNFISKPIQIDIFLDKLDNLLGK